MKPKRNGADPRRPLTPKQQRFVGEYLIDLNATQAAIRAGYSKKSAMQKGCNLLREPRIAAAVAEGKAGQLQRADLSAAMVLDEYRRVAFSNLTDFYKPDGQFKPFSELTEDQQHCLSGLETIVKNAKAGDGVTDTVLKIKLWDKMDALQNLAKHFKLVGEQVDVNVTVVTAERAREVQAARKRLEKVLIPVKVKV